MEAWMSPKPGFHARVRVGRVIVHDDMQREFGRGFELDLVEETDELLMPMARHALANDLAVQHAEGRKQGGRAVAFVVVRPRPTAALLQWKAGLGTIEGLDLTLLVDAQHKGFVRGIEIESDDIVELLDKPFIATELEGLDEMGLEAVSLPDAPDRSLAEVLCLRHGPCAPVGSSRRCGVQGGLDDCSDFAFGDAWDTPRTRGVFFKACQSKRQKPLSPELHGRPGDFQLPRDVLTGHSIRRQLDNAGPLDKAQRKAPSTRPGVQGRSLLGGQKDGGCDYHATEHNSGRRWM